MPFSLRFTNEASTNLDALERDVGLAKRLKAVHKALGLLESNPHHPGLNSRKFTSLAGPNGEEVFESYGTPAAYRIFWRYGPGNNVITIVATTPHP